MSTTGSVLDLFGVAGRVAIVTGAGSGLGAGFARALAEAGAASKAGLFGLTRDLSSQWSGRKGIRVNAIAPGFVETDMISDMSAETLGRFLSGCSLGRVATQREIDAVVVFLASPASGYITGSTIAVDGGTSGH